MTNYYVELGLDRSASIETLEQELKALKKKWTSRASSAPNTEKRQQAERMVDLIREASETLLIKDNKAKYDKQLDKDPTAANAQQSYQQQAAPVPVSFSDRHRLRPHYLTPVRSNRGMKAVPLLSGSCTYPFSSPFSSR